MSSTELIEKPIRKILDGVYINNSGYIFYENNKLLAYTQNFLVEGMKFKINNIIFLVDKTFGKISELKQKNYRR